jgi:transposase
MPKTFEISTEAAKNIEAVRKTVKDKKVDKRMYAVQIRGEGMKNPEIADNLDTSAKVVNRWVSAYCKGGIQALQRGKYGGNRRSFEEEAVLLSEFKECAEKGQIVEVSEIKNAYEKKAGHTIGSSQIYRVLARHGWRKVMPRGKHPNKADDGAIEASKKLT